MSETAQEQEASQTSEESQEQTAQNSEATSDADAAAAAAAADASASSDDALGTDKNQAASEKSGDGDDNTSGDDDVLAGAEASAKEESGGEEKTAAEESAAPESYSDFDLPEGIEMNASYMDKMGPVFKELGLSQANAQKLINAHVGHVQESEVGKADQLTELHKGWLNEAKTDKAIGGDNFDANLKAANAAVNQFGSQDFKQLLRATGLGNHPEIIRVFSKIGGLLGEDIPGNTNVPASSQKVDTLSVMYPDDVPK